MPEEDTQCDDPRDADYFNDLKEAHQPDPHGNWADFIYDPTGAKARWFE